MGTDVRQCDACGNHYPDNEVAFHSFENIRGVSHYRACDGCVDWLLERMLPTRRFPGEFLVEPLPPVPADKPDLKRTVLDSSARLRTYLGRFLGVNFRLGFHASSLGEEDRTAWLAGSDLRCKVGKKLQWFEGPTAFDELQAFRADPKRVEIDREAEMEWVLPAEGDNRVARWRREIEELEAKIRETEEQAKQEWPILEESDHEDPRGDDFLDGPDRHAKRLELQQAIKKNDLEGMKRILRGCSAFVINGPRPIHGRGDEPALFQACSEKTGTGPFRLLLSHPLVDVNRVFDGESIFCQAAGSFELRSLLLRDSRVILGLVIGSRHTPLYWVLLKLDPVKALIADGRPLDENHACYGKTALQNAREQSDWETEGVVALLEEFQANPQGVRRRLRRELGVDEQNAGALYAIIVTCCEGILALQTNEGGQEKIQKARRFFALACRLPMELQSLLCLRVYDCPKDVISRKVTEAEFGWLLERLGMEDYWKKEDTPPPPSSDDDDF